MLTRSRVIYSFIIALILFAVGAVVLWKMMPRDISLIDPKAFQSLSTKDASTIDTSHLNPALLPPTNKWFSGIALQSEPKTIFPTPFAVSLTESTFSYGIPTIVPSGNVITGGMAEKITATVKDAASYRVERYDELSVTVAYRNAAGQTIGSLFLMAGSPYIQFAADTDTSLSLESTLGVPRQANGALAYQSAKGDYVLNGTNLSLGPQAIGMKKGSLVSGYVAKDAQARKQLDAYAKNRVTGAKVSYEKSSDNYQTMFTISTDGGETLLSLLPHQTRSDKALFAYDTLYGKQRVYSGQSFTFTTPAASDREALAISNLSDDQKALLTETLTKDASNTKYPAKDSYYAGKELYRSAQLLQLSEQLDQSTTSEDLIAKLRPEVEKWLSNGDGRSEKYFYFDKKMQSIVGEVPSFGSENGNDHHFHYGYIIYAASILAKYDPEFLKTYRPMVDLIVADIANYHDSEQLMLRRNFDPYFGHSWASGDAPFDDGNNQESSSEAINAWVAVKLWADRTNNQQLRTEASWMLSNEVSATKAYWMDIDTTQNPYDNTYTHSLISLNWSGKREYGTFFSGEPAAKLGIQLIPFNPAQVDIFATYSNQSKHIAESTKAGYSQAFGDYMLMYNTAMNKDERLEAAKKLPDSVIDGANSRTYLYATLLSQ